MGKRAGRRRYVALPAAVVGIVAVVVLPRAQAGRDPVGPHAAASGFLTYKYPIGQPACDGVGLNTAPSFAFSRDDCGFTVFQLSPPPASAEAGVAKLYRPGTTDVFAEVPVTYSAM